jgi:hypothetical protein
MFLFQDRNDKKISKFQYELFSLRLFSVKSFKSKIESPLSVMFLKENYGIFLKHTVKTPYLGSNKLYARTLLRVSIAD